MSSGKTGSSKFNVCTGFPVFGNGSAGSPSANSQPSEKSTASCSVVLKYNRCLNAAKSGVAMRCFLALYARSGVKRQDFAMQAMIY